MKKILPLFLLFCSLFFYGCNKHQFVFIEGQPDPATQNGFVTENDSLEILYNFSGDNIPVSIKVTNKSEKPVYIDWKKSVAIIDGKKYEYWNDNSQIELSGNSFPIDYTIYTQTDGTILKDERVTYIPPRSYIETTRVFLQYDRFVNLPESNMKRIKIQSEILPVKVRHYNFSEENSPLIFRSILAISSKETFTEETFFESTFWVSDIVESPRKSILPQQLKKGNDGPSHTSLISKKNFFWHSAKFFSIFGITAGLLFLSAGN